MGNLHNGHLSLFERASELNNPIFSSIFINPLQFNNKNDFANYPKTLKNDISLLESHNCECLFLPDESILDNIEQIKAPDKANFLCGANRPGHFDGVTTVVYKLFQAVKPNKAFFGLKDSNVNNDEPIFILALIFSSSVIFYVLNSSLVT